VFVHLFITHADGSHMGRFSVVLCLFVCLSVCLFYGMKSKKTDTVRISKREVEMFHPESGKPICSGVKRSKVMRTWPAWVVALL